MGREGNSGSRGRASASGGAVPGKSTPSVYRRRRLVLAVALLMVAALIAGVFALAGSAGSGSRRASDSQAASGATTPAGPSMPAQQSAGAVATPSPTPSCNQNLVTVSGATDKVAYGPGENPMLTLKVTNGGTMPCEVNIGTSQMEFLVTSGADRIFSSRDCQARSEDLLKVLAPGASETANFPWPRNRTVEGCEPVAAKPGAGGAYYIFTAKLGSKASPKAVFQLY